MYCVYCGSHEHRFYECPSLKLDEQKEIPA